MWSEYINASKKKTTTLFIMSWLFGTCMVARQLQKTEKNGLILSLKFYFGKNSKLKLTIYALKNKRFGKDF